MTSSSENLTGPTDAQLAVNTLPVMQIEEGLDLSEKLPEREFVTFVNAVNLAREMHTQLITSKPEQSAEELKTAWDTVLKAFYTAVQLNSDPNTSLGTAAKVTFESEFWVNMLSGTTPNPEAIRHLIRGNEVCAEEATKRTAAVVAKGQSIMTACDFGTGGGNTLLNVRQGEAAAHSTVITHTHGVEISPRLAEITEQRLNAANLNQSTKIHVGNSEEVLARSKFPTLDFATINYSIHHTSHADYIRAAIEKNQIKYRDGVYFFEPVEECATPLPNFETTLAEYLPNSRDKKAFQRITQQIKTGQTVDLNGVNFLDRQQDLLEKLYGKMFDGGVVCIFDPDEGTSAGFNRSHFSNAVTGKADGLMSGMEIGFAAFNDIAAITKRLEATGFKVDRAILQVRLRANGDEAIGQMVEIEQNPLQAGYGKQFGEYAGQVADILGHGVIAHKPSIRETGREQVVGAVARQ